MRILRLTRHKALPEQMAELARIFGADIEIVEISETVPNATRVVEIVTEHSADVLEAVLPLNILADAVGSRGVTIPVIRAITKREIVEGTKTAFTFSHYERVVRVEVQTERL